MKVRLRFLALLFAASAAFSACRRQEAQSPQPGPDASKLSMGTEAPAESEVTASSGAVRLTLRAHKTAIKKGASLWLQISVVNVSSGPLMVRHDDYLTFIGLLTQTYGVSLAVHDEAGRDVAALLYSIHEDHPPLDCMKPEMRKRWEDRARGTMDSAGTDSGVVWLKPGESAVSAPLAYQTGYERYCEGKEPPKPVYPFAEFAQTRSLPSGRYKLLLSYNMPPKAGEKTFPGEVSFKLSPLSFEVLP